MMIMNDNTLRPQKVFKVGFKFLFPSFPSLRSTNCPRLP